MSGLSTLGIVHTAISLVAVGTGIADLARHGRISWATMLGKTYVLTTVTTCLTGFPIVAHGSVGPAHVLGVVTLLTLALVYAAATGRLFGRRARKAEILGFTATLFFHMIPAVAETTTRLPVDAPLAASQDAPLVKAITGALFIVFAAIGIRQLRAERSRGAVPTATAASPSLGL